MRYTVSPARNGGEVKPIEDTIGMKELEDVEVEEVEAIGALPNQEEGAPGEERGDGMGAAEAEH